jgi:ketosteroid isomerase-like protein
MDPPETQKGPAVASTDARSVARSYIEAVGAHNLALARDLFDDELIATFAGTPNDKATWLAALNRLLPALVRNDITDVFADGDRACVAYDFVTNTDGGTVRCVELMTIAQGKIVSLELILDRLAFAPVNKELSERATRA